MAGDVSATRKAVVVRALLGAAATAVVTYLGGYLAAEDDCRAVTPPLTSNCEQGTDSKEAKALVPALAAAVTYLAARGGFEGFVDVRRQAEGDVKPQDVQANV